MSSFIHLNPADPCDSVKMTLQPLNKRFLKKELTQTEIVRPNVLYCIKRPTVEHVYERVLYSEIAQGVLKYRFNYFTRAPVKKELCHFPLSQFFQLMKWVVTGVQLLRFH